MHKVFQSLLLSLLLFTGYIQGKAQGKAVLPSVMVIPSSQFCIREGFKNLDDPSIPDYHRALREDPGGYLKFIMTLIGEYMNNQGYPLTQFENVVSERSLSEVRREMVSDSEGKMLETDPLYYLIGSQILADIIVSLDYQLVKKGPEHVAVVVMSAVDARTAKNVSQKAIDIKLTFGSEFNMFRQGVAASMEDFSYQIKLHFNDIRKNGRPVLLELNIFEGSNLNFNEPLNAGGFDLLLDLVEDWYYENCVGQVVHNRITTDKVLRSEVRIPLSDERGRPLTARRFANTLRKYLYEELSLEAKLEGISLGSASLSLDRRKS